MQTTDKPAPLRRRDLRAYRVGGLRRRSRRQVLAVVAAVLGVCLLAAVTPSVLSGDTPSEAVAALPTRLVGLRDLAARGADRAVRGADGVLGALSASRSGGGQGRVPPSPSPSAMASADAPGPAGASGSGPLRAPSVTAPAAVGSTATASAPAGPEVAAPAGAPQASSPAAEATVMGPAAPPPTGSVPAASAPTPTADEQFAERLVTLTNAERAKAGIPALVTSACATAQAVARAAVLVAQGRFEHDPLGPILSACGASGAGENLALGYPTPEAMTAGWMASPGHRENILRGYASIGIGCVTGSSGVLCSQVFLG